MNILLPGLTLAAVLPAIVGAVAAIGLVMAAVTLLLTLGERGGRR